MKKLKFILPIFVLIQNLAFAGFNDILVADIQYDWIDKNNIEKESIISEVRDIIFEKELPKIDDFKLQFKDKLKDPDFKEHYFAASSGLKEYKDYNISAFYFRNQKFIYMYALQNKKDVSKSYYYDALGRLVYIDFNFGSYPEYPYYTIQYRVSGEPVSAIYYVSKDNQYLYAPNGDFTGVWYKHNLYDKHSKVILRRTEF